MSGNFDWSYPGLNRHHFTAFGNLLALRNGGQVEQLELASFSEDLLPENQPEDGSETSSIDTSRADRISNAGHDVLKRKFLDCLAEFAANKKGGRSVACTSMRESEESVIIWIARNEGFQTMESDLFEGKLANLLTDISCDEGIPSTDRIDTTSISLTLLGDRQPIIRKHIVGSDARIPT